MNQDYQLSENYYRKACESKDNAISVPSCGSLGTIFLVDPSTDVTLEEAIKYLENGCETGIANNCGNLAVLYDEQKDFVKSKHYHLIASRLGPNNAVIAANFSKLLFALGETSEAQRLLSKLENLDTSDLVLSLEIYFYKYAHLDENKEIALNRIKGLLEEGVRSPGWDLTQNVYRAGIIGHPNPIFLEALSKVIGGDAPIETLGHYNIWNAL